MVNILCNCLFLFRKYTQITTKTLLIAMIALLHVLQHMVNATYMQFLYTFFVLQKAFLCCFCTPLHFYLFIAAVCNSWFFTLPQYPRHFGHSPNIYKFFQNKITNKILLCLQFFYSASQHVKRLRLVLNFYGMFEY